MSRATDTADRVVVPVRGALLRRVHHALASAARRLVYDRLRHVRAGLVTVIDGERLLRVGDASGPSSLRVTIRVHDPSFYSALVLRGSVGAAESYVLGEWDCDDLTALVRIAALEAQLTERLLRDSAALFVRPLLWLAHRLRRNTAAQSRRNVAAHYDLGNEFFELFLDPTLTYSCAVFETDSDTLERAQIAKYDRICRKLGLQPGHRLVEIGTGWGGFAIHAASRYGCDVVTTTNSRAQCEFARERARAAGLSQSVTVLNDDYRDVTGHFDRLVSIEMIEAVGAAFLGTFLATCSRLLRPDGAMLLQAILTPDSAYRASLRSVDFIKRYVFPGGQLPSIGAIRTAIARTTDLRLLELEDLTPHYVTTLRCWADAFASNRSRIAACGYPESFLRLWKLYLHSCEGYFRERAIGVAQIAFAKPACQDAVGLPI